MNDKKLIIGENKGIKKNTFFSFLTTSIRVVANFFLFWTIARYYGAEIFGQFTYAFTVITIFLFIADFGLDILLTIELPKNRSRINQIFQALFSIKIFFIGFTFILLIIYSLLINLSSTSFWLLIILSFYLIMTSLLNYLIAFFKGLEELRVETIVTFVYHVALILAVIVLCYIRANIYFFALALVVFRFLSLIIAYKYLLSYKILLKPNINFEHLKQYKNQVGIFGIHYIFNYLYYNIDTLLLAYILGENSVGIFQAAFKLLVMLLIIPEIINNALLPTLSRLNNESQTVWQNLALLMNKLLLIIILPASVIIYFNAHNIINLVYNTQYFEAIPVLKIYTFAIIIRFMIEPLGMLLTTSNQQRVRAVTVLLVTCVSIILNIFFIQKYNVLGVAYTAIITNFIVLIIYIGFNIKLWLEWYLNRNMMFFIISVIVFMIIIHNTFGLFFHIGLYMFYLISYGYFIFLDLEERKLLIPNSLIKAYFRIKK